MSSKVAPSEAEVGRDSPPPSYDAIDMEKGKEPMPEDEDSKSSEVDPWDMPHISIPIVPWGGKQTCFPCEIKRSTIL